MLLFVASYCLSSSKFYLTHCDYAKKLLLLFVKKFEKLYGREMMVYTVHNLIHLSSDVGQFGPLDNFSAFSFESLLGRLKKMLRKTDKPLKQLIRRYEEQRQWASKQHTENEHRTATKGLHQFGSLPLIYKNYLQYSSILKNNFLFSVKCSDNCGKIKDKVCLIRNILKKDYSIVFCMSLLSKRQIFFKTPLPSSHLGIYKVSKLSGIILVATFSDLVCKVCPVSLQKKVCGYSSSSF